MSEYVALTPTDILSLAFNWMRQQEQNVAMNNLATLTNPDDTVAQAAVAVLQDQMTNAQNEFATLLSDMNAADPASVPDQYQGYVAVAADIVSTRVTPLITPPITPPIT